MINYDKRTNYQFLKDYVLRLHLLVNTFWRHSVFEPLFIKILNFFVLISLIFTINSFVYSDNQIAYLNIFEGNKKLFFVDFITRSIMSSILVMVFTKIFSFIKYIPNKFRIELNQYLATRNTLLIRIG